jgi:hypothetical protein
MVGEKSSEGGIIPNRGSTLRSPNLVGRCGSRKREASPLIKP